MECQAMISCSTDPLDNEEIWHDLIMGYVNAPMNYGTDIGAVRPLALAAGISPSRAIAKVQTFYHQHDTMN
jgi:hypothetical protein